MTATQTIPANEQEKTAAAIRRIVTPGFFRTQVDTAAADPETAQILPLLMHLLPGRCPEAARAHRALVKQVRSDLVNDGIASADHFKLIELLYHYLESSGYRFYYQPGRWEDHQGPKEGVVR